MTTDVTTEMTFAAIKQAVKEGIIEGEHVPTEEYLRMAGAWGRVIEAVINEYRRNND